LAFQRLAVALLALVFYQILGWIGMSSGWSIVRFMTVEKAVAMMVGG